MDDFKKYKYDVAISFANEDRNAALALALALEMAGFRTIYYYHDHPAATATEKLRPTLRKIFSEESKYIAVLLSKKYFKKGPDSAVNTELNVIYERINSSKCKIDVMLIKLQNNLKLSGYPILQEMTFSDWNFDPKGIANILKENFGTTKQLIEAGKLRFKNVKQDIRSTQLNTASVAKSQQNNLIIK